MPSAPREPARPSLQLSSPLDVVTIPVTLGCTLTRMSVRAGLGGARWAERQVRPVLGGLPGYGLVTALLDFDPTR